MTTLGQFQGLMALPETQCEYCVVRVLVRVCAVCVFCGKPLYMPVRKSRCVFVCVSRVCVCRDHVCVYIRAIPSPSVSTVL